MIHPKKGNHLKHSTLQDTNGRVVNMTQISDELKLDDREMKQIEDAALKLAVKADLRELGDSNSQTRLTQCAKELISEFPREFSLATQDYDDPERAARIAGKIIQRGLSNLRRNERNQQRKPESPAGSGLQAMPVRSRESSATVMDPLLTSMRTPTSNQPAPSYFVPPLGLSASLQSRSASVMWPAAGSSTVLPLDLQIHARWRPDERLSMVSISDILDPSSQVSSVSPREVPAVSFNEFINLICEDFQVPPEQIGRKESQKFQGIGSFVSQALSIAITTLCL